MSDYILIQIHLGQDLGPDDDGEITPPAEVWHPGDAVQAYLLEDLPPAGNIMRRVFAYVKLVNPTVSARLHQRKLNGERMPTEDIETRYGPNMEILERSIVKRNLAALSANRRAIVNDPGQDSPVMTEIELPTRGKPSG